MRLPDMVRFASARGALCLGLCLAFAAADAETPLLMEGKTTLYQRVLLRNATAARDAPDGTANASLPPLTALFVYERSGDWLRVAAGDAADTTFWVPAADAVDWRQNIVVTLDGSENVGRLLFFADENTAYEVIESESPADMAGELLDEAAAAETGGPRSERIVALGPTTAVDQRTSPYVMPILETQEAIFENGTFVNLLKVAVARADAGARDPAAAGTIVEVAPGGAPTPGDIREGFRAGVVFVVDTSISMQPYIDETKAVLEQVYDQVASSNLGGAISFGLVGYRDNVAAVPALEYAARKFVDLAEGTDRNRFESGISKMKEATASSRNFREDSYNGISYALSSMDWSPFAARYIVLVTDAGPREAGDALSQTGLSAGGLANIIQEQLGGAIAVLHLKTRQGQADHASAEAAYSFLASRDNQSALYFPVEDADPTAYSAQATKLGQMIVEQLGEFRGGGGVSDRGTGAESAGAEVDDAMRAAIRSAGRTMQLAYLGRETGAEAPDVFEAYVADRDFTRTALRPLSVRVLLTKNQLSDLEQAMSLITQQSESSILAPDQFFDQVLAAASDVSRRPDQVAARGDESLADVAAIAEYLEGLPYRSQIMNITRDRWVSMHAYEQQTVMNDIYDKIERYRRYNAATELWINYLGSDGVLGDGAALLYAMLLDDLP